MHSFMVEYRSKDDASQKLNKLKLKNVFFLIQWSSQAFKGLRRGMKKL